MPHDLPTVLCNLLHSSTEVPLDTLAEAADEASRGCLGGQWHTEEHCPSSSPVGVALQAAHKDLGKVDFRAPEGLLAGLGCAITRPGHCYQFQQANLASDRHPISHAVKSVGSTPVQCVDHLVPLFVVELFRFLSLGLELSGDLPPWSVFALTILAGLSGM